jgi:photosystem II stability/assembly factor-like uncharacterized protein
MADEMRTDQEGRNGKRISRRSLLRRCALCVGAAGLSPAWRKLKGAPTLIGSLASASVTSDKSGPAPRYDRWQVIGPGGGGGMFLPTISPHDARCVLEYCDMTGAYISHDGGDSWRMFNLGGSVSFFLFDSVDPKVIYVKTSGGVRQMANDRSESSSSLFRSVDAGQTWSLVREDSPSITPTGIITALAVDPSDSSIIYAAFQNRQDFVLYISPDKGRNWERVADLPGGAVSIIIDPRSPRKDRTLYVLGAGSVTVREGGRWRSGEALKGLVRLKSEPDLLRGVVSAGFPQQGGKLVVYMIAARNVHISDDGGERWRESPLPAATWPLVASAVGTSLGHPDVAYVSYRNRRRGSEALFGTARTEDRGRSWKLVWKESTTSAPNMHDSWLSKVFGPGWGGNPLHLGVAPNDPDLCFGTDSGRTLRTTDGGRTWRGVYSKELPDRSFTTTGLDVTTCYGVHFDPFNSRRVFITYTDIGLFRSENGGRGWLSSTVGVPKPWVNTTYWIVFDPKVQGRVWGAMSGAHDLPRPKMWAGGSVAKFTGGVCRSDDGGKTWKSSSEGLPQTAATHILLDPGSPVDARVLYAVGFGRGVFKSDDGGSHWILKNQGIGENEPLAWRLARDSDGVLYLVVARRSDDGGIGGEGDGALYRSVDGAEHWTTVRLPKGCNGPEGLATDPHDPRRLYLAAWGRRRPDHAGDGYVLHPTAGDRGWREAIVKGQTAYAGGGIFLSTDSGGSWRQVLANDQHVYDITIDPHDPSILYACGFESSAWRSTDRGESWQRIKGFDFKWGHRVIPDPDERSKVYITTYGGGVWHGPARG